MEDSIADNDDQASNESLKQHEYVPKNIVLCADGTGNEGGYTPDSNVFKTYNGVDIHHPTIKQITFYDNGVGTAKNKILRALSGALGFGFASNVKDLYEYLAKHYCPGDKIYLFGFSRGAATIRAFMGFVGTCGLVKGNGLAHDKLKQYTCEAFEAYKKHKRHPEIAKRFREHDNSNNVVPIEFIGVWDSVSALGLPDHMDQTGFLSWVLNLFFKYTDKILNLFWPHHFYVYDLNDKVKHAYQALALDDARTSFWPLVFDENKHQQTQIEQVWFAGMHANVGGGYERTGLATVALHWMLVRASHHDLHFKKGFVQQQEQDANVNGRLYNSRDGVAIFYRYHPREIDTLCKNKMRDNEIKIHETVIDRMQQQTADYAPTHLPPTFRIANTAINKKGKLYELGDKPGWKAAVKAIRQRVNLRKMNYIIMLTFAVIIAVSSIVTWVKGVEYWGRSGLTGHLADIADYFMPEMLEPMVEVAFMHYPITFAVLLLLVYWFWKYNQSLRNHMHLSAVKIRDIVLAAIPK